MKPYSVVYHSSEPFTNMAKMLNVDQTIRGVIMSIIMYVDYVQRYSGDQFSLVTYICQNVYANTCQNVYKILFVLIQNGFIVTMISNFSVLSRKCS